MINTPLYEQMKIKALMDCRIMKDLNELPFFILLILRIACFLDPTYGRDPKKKFVKKIFKFVLSHVSICFIGGQGEEKYGMRINKRLWLYEYEKEEEVQKFKKPVKSVMFGDEI